MKNIFFFVLEGLDEALRRTRSWISGVDTRVEAVAHHTAQVATNLFRSVIPKRTGEAAQSLSWEPTAEGAQVQVTGRRADIIEMLRYGTRPHEIVARRKSLAFMWPGGPQGSGIHFYRRVMHPGTRPNDFVLGMLETIRQQYNDDSQDINKLFEGD